MEFRKTPLNEVKRGAKKAVYTKEEIYAILDATEICHIAFVYEKRPFVQPINFGRNGDKLYLHGSLKNRMMDALLEAQEVCLNVVLLDAMKLTRSAFHHSVNYRSVMVFGSVRALTEDKEKLKGLKSIINHFVPHRWEHCRPPNQKELNATRVLEISIESASAKIANSPPSDNKSDLDSGFWAGSIPVRKHYGPPIPDAFMDEQAEVPEHVVKFCER